MSTSDTIFALSSGRPPAALAVVRISGPQAGAALLGVMRRIPPPRQAAFATLRHPQTGEPLDQALVLWFPAPGSETGEDVAELQVHGGAAVIASILGALGTVPGLRMAEPGEFTRRALENGKLDLSRVEGLADLIGAETDAQRRQALHQLAGSLARKVEGWRETLTRARALVESALDFADEGDVPAEAAEEAKALAARLATEIAEVVGQADRGERVREGLTIAIAGPPNAGKSSLFNWLAQREAAIVSPHPGTTRDVLELRLDLGGFAVTVLDTAGVRESDDPVEQEGIRRARARAEAADLTLWVEDLTQAGGRDGSPPSKSQWTVLNKADLIDSSPERVPKPGARSFVVSARTGVGLPELLEALVAFAGRSLAAAEPALVTRERQRASLQNAHAALTRTREYGHGSEEMLAEELRLASRSLERLIGRVDVEDVLDVIFRDFCIGK